MPRYASNKMPRKVKRRYFERIRQGLSGSEAACEVGVSLSCGSNWFIEELAWVPQGTHRRWVGTDDLTEKMDSRCTVDGRPYPQHFVLGFKVEDGKIAVFQEYFDSQLLASAQNPEIAKEAVVQPADA